MLEIKTDEIISRKDLQPLKAHISGKDFDKNQTEFDNNNAQKQKQSMLAFQLLVQILEIDKKDLSALDGGKKSYAEIYNELSGIVGKEIVKELGNKSSAKVDELAGKTREEIKNEHKKVMVGLGVIEKKQEIIPHRIRQLMGDTQQGIFPPNSFLKTVEGKRNIRENIKNMVEEKTGLEPHSQAQALWTEREEGKPVSYKDR